MSVHQPVTVSELTQAIRSILEEDFETILVEGEISQIKRHSSGHLYFSLKDSGAVLPCCMWRNQASRLVEVPREGDAVVVSGRLTVYEPRGAYQLVANHLKPAGQGDLAARFEELKRKLAAEGLFEASRKKDLPVWPFRVAVVTSPTGAVIQDIQHVLSRRSPHLELLIVPAAVQGAECVPSVVRALERLAALEGTEQAPDVVVIARGGGSMEDLWGFNEELLVRAVAACPFPTVSAVGHETDTTLCDHVADLRAPTPSAAAELVGPERLALLAELQESLERSGDALLRLVERRRERLDSLAGRPSLSRPEMLLERPRQSLDLFTDRLERAGELRLERTGYRIASLAGRLDALSPLRVLSRGYAAIQTSEGRVVTSAAALHAGDAVDLLFGDGKVAARVEGSVR
ncbi:MAG: exodeoxyribonuclease VII large subunit [Fibrobacteria bacterium]|nr:exodeoxyribonuclease VII large subunit [Fibrobacteria bacterium]